jgi:replicative DNA helicase
MARDILQPPYDLDAEKSVLASIMLDKEALIKAADILQPDDFYDPTNKTIYQGCLELFHNSSAVDSVTVKSYLTKNNLLKKAGAAKYLNEIVSILPLTTNVEYYSKLIKEDSLRRKVISMSSEMVGLGMDESRKFSDIIDDIEKRIYQISESSNLKGFTHIREIISDITERLENVDKNQDKLRGLSTGFGNLDKYIGGLHGGDLVILAARPSVGKTAFMLEMMRHLSVGDKGKGQKGLGKTVLAFSLEMGQDQLGDRLLSLQSEIPLQEIRFGDLTGEKYAECSKAMAELYDSQIIVDDTPGQHIAEIRTKCRKWDMEIGVDAIFVDYLQLLQGRNKDNRAQEVSEISQGLKNIARELKVPLVALSQLNRSVESRNDRRPQLSDLRESGSIEQDADIVIFLHREAYYNKEMDEADRNKAEAIVAKNRNGATGIASLRFLDVCAKYLDGEEGS